MSDIIENEEADRDIVEQNVLEELFAKRYDLVTEASVSLKKTYINKISGTKSLKFAIILLDNSIEVYELSNSSLTRICHLRGHEKTVTEVVFNPREENMLFSASEDGLVKMWDIRASGSFVQDYKDEEEEMIRPYECMDISHNGRVMCAGSQLVEDDAFLVFWDQRAPKPLGGYWNSHTDDITQVKFHKEKMEILATGSLDGLVNIFNLTEQTEADALSFSLNVENSVDKISWLDDKTAAFLTQSNGLQLWDTRTGDLICIHDREKIAHSIKRSRADDCYLVDAFMSADEVPVLLAGSYGGDEDTLRSVRLAGRRLVPLTNFGSNRQVVRSCWYDDDRDLLVTAGESGVINVWRGERPPGDDLDSDDSEESDTDMDDASIARAARDAAQPPSTPRATRDAQVQTDEHVERDDATSKLTDALAKLHANRHKPY